MLILDTELTVDGRAEALWGVWTDVERWAEWDPHEEEAHIHGRFETGATGFSKPRGAPPGEFTVVEAREPLRWVTRSGLPVGSLIFEHTIDPVDDSKCRLRLRATAQGPMGVVVRIGWGRAMRADAVLTLAALGQRATTLAR